MPYNAVHGDHAANSAFSPGSTSPGDGYVPIARIQQSILEAMHLSYQMTSSLNKPRLEPSIGDQKPPVKHARPKKYSRPCDGCAFKKVRCSGTVPCTRCVQNNVECTSIRIRKKCGPKPKEIKLRQMAQSRTGSESSVSSATANAVADSVAVLSSSQSQLLNSIGSTLNSKLPEQSKPSEESPLISTNSTSPKGAAFARAATSSHTDNKLGMKFTGNDSNIQVRNHDYLQKGNKVERQPPSNNYPKTKGAGTSNTDYAKISLDDQIPTLHIFQTWYYGFWPVVSVPCLISKLSNVSFDEPMTYETSANYALSLSICAAISRAVSFLSPDNAQIVSFSNKIDSSVFANECLRIMHAYNHRIKPSTETLLASFFLYFYYINDKDGVNASILYLREAISIAQLMKLHDPKTLQNKSSTESHRLTKIYYLLLVTERYTNIQEDIPVVLDALIPLPSLYDEEYPSLLSGFTELVKVFLAPSRLFFNRLRSSKSDDLRSDFADFLGEGIGAFSNSAIVEIQTRLNSIELLHPTSAMQAANIILSKYWMMSLVWHASHTSGLISASGDDNNCLSVAHPHKIAHEFLSAVSELPIFAFESNGPGAIVKLLEIADSLADSAAEVVQYRAPISFPVSSIYDSIQSVFGMVLKFKTNFSLPDNLHKKIEAMLNSRPLTRSPDNTSTGGYITEIRDGEGDNETNSKHHQLQSDLKGIIEDQVSVMEIVPRTNSSEYLEQLFQPTYNSELVSPVDGTPYSYFFNGADAANDNEYSGA